MPRNPSFPIQIRSTASSLHAKSGRRSGRIKQIPRRRHLHHDDVSASSNLSAMKIFNRFRKILVRLLFSVGGGKKGGHAAAAGEIRVAEPPKTSCSSYYSTQLHYSEAIADCIEFLNKAGGSPDGSSSVSGSSGHGQQPDLWV